MNTLPVIIETDTMKRSSLLVKCDECDSDIDNIDDIEIHIETVHDKTFKCKTCDTNLSNESILKEHGENEHESSVMMEFDQCDKIYRSKEELENHVVMDHGSKLESTFCNPSIFLTTEVRKNMKKIEVGEIAHI